MFSKRRKNDYKPLLTGGLFDDHVHTETSIEGNGSAGERKRRVVILGANSATGREVVGQALQRGYGVTALVRNERDVTQSQNINLEIFSADVFSTRSLVEHLKGKDTVISCLGNLETSTWRPTTFYTDSIEKIINAMRQTGVRRLVCLTTWYTDYKGTSDSLMSKLAYWSEKPFQMFTKGTLDNMKLMERYITSCDDINYTIVRPPMLTDGPLTDDIIAQEGQRVPYRSLLKSCRTGIISRASLAHFMLDCLEEVQWDRKGVAIDQKRHL